MAVRAFVLSAFLPMALLGASACKNDGGSQHGTVQIRLIPQSVGGAELFAGTAEIFVEVEYNECIRSYYADHPEWLFEGEKGNAEMMSWVDQLCDPDRSDEAIPCQVKSLSQLERIGQGFTDLRANYTITGSGIQYKDLTVGPFPDSDRTGCESKVIIKPNTLEGYASDGSRIWFGSSVDGNDQPKVDDSPAVRVNIIR